MGRMLEALARAEAELPTLLQDKAGWNSLDVDYEPPRVERLWRTLSLTGQLPFERPYRLYLHRIHPCSKALYHPHPWPSAIRIVNGGYEMGVGYGSGQEPPPIAARMHLVSGSSYEMEDIDGWHYVLPSVPNLSIMVTGHPWERWAPGPDPSVKLGPLTEMAIEELLADFRIFYPMV